ncbi:MAG: T9SS type A sorting domain-containing protein, partial [Prolixibacteraceae bacterium]|nr:T9SS type A sorting domain-containing protein [Prolixibacteraceae bacterium]
GSGGYNGAYLGSVGGISFENTAVLNEGFQIDKLEILYDNSQIDGSRIELTINENKTHVKIFDWQLIPIAKYANSEYTACFTYFGDLEDEYCQNIILNNNGHILNYHPEFANTLVGWRLADMDMLILYDFTTDLPKKDNNYILGAGEQIPDVDANNTGAFNFYNYFISIENNLGYTFQSYVISDYSQVIEISTKNDSLKISGYPYYYCWRLRIDMEGFNVQEAGDSIANYYQTLLNQKLQENPGFNERGLYIDSLISLSNDYPFSYEIYSGGTFIDLVAIETEFEKRVFLEQYSTASLKSLLIDVTTYMFAYEAVLMKEFSDRMSANPEMISAWNPAVWDATVNTMRFSAFFRYIKLNFPGQWQSFLAQISLLEPKPAVITPTVIYDKGNAIIEQALEICPVEEIGKRNEISIFPNPVKNILNLQNLSGDNTIQIVSMDGKTNFSEIANSRNKQIVLKGFPDGTYIINVLKDGKIIESQKIIKE